MCNLFRRQVCNKLSTKLILAAEHTEGCVDHLRVVCCGHLSGVPGPVTGTAGSFPWGQHQRGAPEPQWQPQLRGVTSLCPPALSVQGWMLWELGHSWGTAWLLFSSLPLQRALSLSIFKQGQSKVCWWIPSQSEYECYRRWALKENFEFTPEILMLCGNNTWSHCPQQETLKSQLLPNMLWAHPHFLWLYLQQVSRNYLLLLQLWSSSRFPALWLCQSKSAAPTGFLQYLPLVIPE